jgi:Ca-activated chloride channel homolog
MLFRFDQPWFLLLLLAVPLLYWWRRRLPGGGEAALRFSDVRNIRRIRPTLRLQLGNGLFLLRLLAVVVMVLALARPQSGLVLEEITSDGVDIMLTIDVSGSMQSPDYKPKDRLDVAKETAEKFIRARRNDRIGLVVFAGEAYLQCPLTLDYGVLLNFLRENVKVLMGTYRVGNRMQGMIEDGTAIGMALALSIKRLRDSETKSKVVILLTDGANNRGEIDPLQAAEIARALGIKIYTIGVGRDEAGLRQQVDPLLGRFFAPGHQADYDEENLKQIAEKTNARFFRAADPKALEKAFEAINALEATEIKVEEYQKFSELFVWFAGLALALLVFEFVLRQTVLRKIP